LAKSNFGLAEDSPTFSSEQTITAQEKFARLRLSRTDNIGPITFTKLLARYGTAIRALEALPHLAARGGRKKPLIACPQNMIEDEIAAIEKAGAHLVVKGEEDYPYLLAQLEDAPPALTVKGNLNALSQKSLAIVGTRNASINGRKITQDIAARVGMAGYYIASGLARGIDTCAHQAALDSGTIAVLAGGVDVIYPAENESLYNDILSHSGAIIAENPIGTQPQARHFPRRNRIISGISLGTLVVEANLKSGSLITARMTLEQNRELFCIPGSPLDPRAAGTNKLLKEGAAHLVTHADDVLNVLNDLRISPLFEAGGSFNFDGFDTGLPDTAEENSVELHDEILSQLSTSPVHVDELIRALHASIGASVPEVLSVLLELELAGRLERHHGNRVNLIEDDSF
jgi:DNA processing protein